MCFKNKINYYMFKNTEPKTYITRASEGIALKAKIQKAMHIDPELYIPPVFDLDNLDNTTYTPEQISTLKGSLLKQEIPTYFQEDITKYKKFLQHNNITLIICPSGAIGNHAMPIMKQIDENNKQEILKEFLTDQELKYFISACNKKAKKMQKTLTPELTHDLKKIYFKQLLQENSYKQLPNYEELQEILLILAANELGKKSELNSEPQKIHIFGTCHGAQILWWLLGGDLRQTLSTYIRSNYIQDLNLNSLSCSETECEQDNSLDISLDSKQDSETDSEQDSDSDTETDENIPRDYTHTISMHLDHTNTNTNTNTKPFYKLLPNLKLKKHAKFANAIRSFEFNNANISIDAYQWHPFESLQNIEGPISIKTRTKLRRITKKLLENQL